MGSYKNDLVQDLALSKYFEVLGPELKRFGGTVSDR